MSPVFLRRRLPAVISSLLFGLSVSTAFLAVAADADVAPGRPSGAGMAAPATMLPTITLAVDLTHAPERRFEAHETLAVTPGPLTLHYPKWIPGEHAPSGPINGVTGLMISANGKPLAWRRKLDEMFDLQLEVPAGVSTIDLRFQYIPAGEGGFSSSPSATPHLAELEWNQVVFYPAGHAASAIPVNASVRVPTGWQFATALENKGGLQADGAQAFGTVSLETLIDSPVFTGEYFKRIDLGKSLGVPVRLNLVADRPANLVMKPEQMEHARNMVQQFARLTGAVHYRHYDFLFALSDHTGQFGLEHHESSDDRLAPDFYTDESSYLADPALLPHEYFHSWNGKFRRPAGLATQDYSQPMLGDLLWVYEGLTNYYGEVLAARSGGWTPAQFRDQLAVTAAAMQFQTGRTWRPLRDTADAAQLLYGAPPAYGNWRRSVDYYPEGTLLWLDVDTQIRTLTQGKKSLDDFVRAFHGIHPGQVEVLPYTMDDVVSTLNGVASHDWREYLEERLQSLQAEAPLDGLTRGGWTLSFSDKPSEYFKAREKSRKEQILAYGLGLTISQDEEKGGKGTLLDVRWDSPAFQAGLVPGTRLLAVNGEDYTPEVLNEAIKAAAHGGPSLTLLVKDGSVYRVHQVNYTGGLRYPVLDARKDAEDLIGAISAPLK